tara:strand:- start:188 stop:1225 length:1038 start_codon:yes stop_codon:yes gene_type:complete
MKVYWGGVSTGKNFLKQYCSHNNMSWGAVHEYYVLVKSFKIHYSFLDKLLGELDNRMWCDYTRIFTLHYSKNNIPHESTNSQRIVENTKMMNMEASVQRVFNQTNYMMDENLINSSTGTKGHEDTTPVSRKIQLNSKQVSMILQSDDLTDSLMVSRAVKQYANKLKDNLLDEILPKDIPQCDILIPSRYMKNNIRIRSTREIPHGYNEHDVIVPYKSNIKHHVETVLDFVGGFQNRGHDIVKLYKDDKKWLWDYLDEYCLYLHIHAIEQSLRENNIKYRYFDMDNDSYPDFFGGKMTIDRHCTNPFTFQIQMAKDKELAQKKYDILQEMSDEYITSRKLTDVRLP